jgi:hypothetical protein
LSFIVSVYDVGCSLFGVRHSCKSSDLADFMGENCADLYKEVNG